MMALGDSMTAGFAMKEKVIVDGIREWVVVYIERRPKSRGFSLHYYFLCYEVVVCSETFIVLGFVEACTASAVTEVFKTAITHFRTSSRSWTERSPKATARELPYLSTPSLGKTVSSDRTIPRSVTVFTILYQRNLTKVVASLTAFCFLPNWDRFVCCE